MRDYLQIVLDMESNLYVQEKLIDGLKQEYRQLRPLAYPEEPTVPQPPQGKKSGSAAPWILAALAGGIICVWLYGVEVPDSIASATFKKVVVTFWFSLCIASVLCLYKGLGCLNNKSLEREQEARYEKETHLYETKQEQFKEKMLKTRALNLRIEKQQAVLEANLHAVEKQHEESRSTLAQLYSANLIHPKYRNLSAVSTLFEYFDTRRYNTLEGPDGAYNRLEEEADRKQIILKLDHISEQLDAIRNSQHQLYLAVSEGNQRTESLLSAVSQDVRTVASVGRETAKSLSGVEANSRIIAYNTERAHKELEYFNRMRYQLGDYDRVWENHRP